MRLACLLQVQPRGTLTHPVEAAIKLSLTKIHGQLPYRAAQTISGTRCLMTQSLPLIVLPASGASASSTRSLVLSAQNCPEIFYQDLASFDKALDCSQVSGRKYQRAMLVITVLKLWLMCLYFQNTWYLEKVAKVALFH